MADETPNILVCHRAHRHWCTVVFGGALIDRSPYAELCNAAYALVKRQIPDDAVQRKGECLVIGSGALHTVRWAYSTATSREREMPPFAYEAKVALTARPITCAR
ncbi:MAG: hypothetical protein ACREYC_23410 [Gammaproteobacteria bacterium]